MAQVTIPDNHDNQKAEVVATRTGKLYIWCFFGSEESPLRRLVCTTPSCPHHLWKDLRSLQYLEDFSSKDEFVWNTQTIYKSCQNPKWPHTRKSIDICVYIVYGISLQVSPKDCNFLAQRLSILGPFFLYLSQQKEPQKLDFSPFFRGTYDPEWIFGMRLHHAKKKDRITSPWTVAIQTNVIYFQSLRTKPSTLVKCIWKKIQKYLPKIWLRNVQNLSYSIVVPPNHLHIMTED